MKEFVFEYNASKNDWLKENRGIGFEEIISRINEGGLLDVVCHPNSEKYQGQAFYVIDMNGYVYLVPFVREGDKVFLKTIFPSRKFTRQYLKSGAREK